MDPPRNLWPLDPKPILTVHGLFSTNEDTVKGRHFTSTREKSETRSRGERHALRFLHKRDIYSGFSHRQGGVRIFDARVKILMLRHQILHDTQWRT